MTPTIKRSKLSSPEAQLIITSLFVLTLGVLTYVFYRPVKVLFVPRSITWNCSGDINRVFAFVCNSIPTFSHTLGFTLLSFAVLWPWPYLAVRIGVFWLLFESILEIGQMDRIAGWITSLIPDAVTGIPGLNLIGPYFSLGTFDPWDLISILVGSVSALGILQLTRRKEIICGVKKVKD